MPNYFVDHHEPCLCHPTGFEHVVREENGANGRDTLRVLTLNVRHARGPRRRTRVREVEGFRDNVERIAGLLRDAPADVVALQEADAPSFWSGRHHHVERFSEVGGFGEFAHGLHMNLCRPRFGLSYGTALLARVPLSSVESLGFQARPLDPKGFVIATVKFGGRKVDVVSVHLDLVLPVQRRQVAALVRALRRRPRPLIVMGDLNSTGRRPRSAVQRLSRDLGLVSYAPSPDDPAAAAALASFPSWKPSLRLDWILVSPELEFRSCTTLREPVSDHLAVRAELAWREPA